jgi:DNA-binding CsgD family transcriptional regulator/tetratricopeptide (TPR) repeat protein
MSRFLCPTVVGREEELASLYAGLERARAGRGGAIVLLGEAGSGKSRLARECGRRAKKFGMRVLVGRAVDAATPAAYRPLAEAMAPIPRAVSLTEVPAPFRTALGGIVADWRRDAVEGGDSPVLVGEGLLHLLRAVDDGRGLLVVLEDLHWADPETVDVVEYLVDNIGEQPVLCVVTTRPDAYGAVPGRLGALVERGSASAVEVRPLSGSDAARMAALSLGVGAVPSGLSEFLLRTDGLPLFVEEMLAAAADAGALLRVGDGWEFAPTERSPIPVTVRGTIARRLGALTATERSVIGAAALLGRRFDVDLVGPIVAVEADVAMAALRRCADQQLLVLEAGDVRFRHALTRDAVLDQMLGPERTLLARSALTVIKRVHPELPARWCELAAALHEEAGELAAAAELLLVAGRREHATGALRTAADILMRARGLADPRTTVEIDRALLQVLTEAGRVDDALEIGEQLLSGLSDADPGRADVHLQLARAAVAAGRWSLARTQIIHVRGAGSVRAAQVDALAAHVELGAGQPEDAVGLAEQAIAWAGHSEHAAQCEALEVLGRVARLRDIDQARTIFTRQLAVAEDGTLAVWRLRALLQLGTLDLIAGPVLDGMVQARAVAVEQGALATTANIDLQIASNLGGGFRVDECLQVAERCADLARRWRLGSMLPIAQVVAASAHGIAGRRPEMEQLIAQALEGDVDDEVRLLVRGRCRAIVALLDEDHATALAEFDAAMDLVRATPAPTLRPWFALWALLRTVHERDGAQARAEVRRQMPAGTPTGEALMDFAEAVARGRAGEPSIASALVSAADRTLAPVADCYSGYHQLALRLTAEAALDDGWGEPVRWLSDATVFFHGHGHHAVVRACGRLLRRAGAVVPRIDSTSTVPAVLRRYGITEREHDVLLLVAAGRTSAQIADELVISRRTVDKHVERLLAKTGARRRGDLRGLVDSPHT